MEKPFDFKVAVELAMARNEDLWHSYRDLVRPIRVLSVHKVIQSIVDQKTKHSEILSSIREAASTPANPPVGIAQSLLSPIASGKDSDDLATSLLKLVLEEESRMAALYACLRDAAKDDETHQNLRTLSEASLKFVGWVKDHLELRELF